MAVKNLYNTVNKYLTGDDIDSRFNNSLPSIQIWSWTAIANVFISVAQIIGTALIAVKPVIGAIFSVAGNILNTLLNVTFGNEDYGVNNRAVNCYLGTPIIAYSRDTQSNDTAPRMMSTPYLDVFVWNFGGKRYLNGYLKPVSSLDGAPLWAVYDRNAGTYLGDGLFGTLSYDGSALGATFTANFSGLHYSPDLSKLNTFLIRPDKFSSLDYMQDMGCMDLATTNVALLNSILCVISTLMLPNAAVANKVPYTIYAGGVYFTNPVVHIKAIPSIGNSNMTLQECANLACAYLYYATSQSGSFTNNNMAIALSNIIISIRNLTESNPLMTYPSEWSYDLSPTSIQTVDPSIFGNYYILDQFLVNTAYFYNNATGFRFNADAWNYASIDWDDFTTGTQRAVAISIAVGLPSKFKYTMPSTTPLFRALAFATTAAIVATTAITAVAIKVSYTKKLKAWQIEKAEAFNQQKQKAYGPEGTQADREKYIKDVYKYNLLANFIPGAATWNPVSGRMQNTMYDSGITVSASTSAYETIDKVYSIVGAEGKQNQDGFERIIHLVTGL
jgi:hypothetical protein